MFGLFTYPMKVSNALFRLGWTPETLPPSMDNGFWRVINALRKSGLSPERAADLLDGALQGDHDCLQSVVKLSGVAGISYFGPKEAWIQNADRFLVKPNRPDW